jgi:carotenoid 1,2-hydratase
VREKSGVEKLLALQFNPNSTVTDFEIGNRHPLPKTMWKIQRNIRSDRNNPSIIQDLEDTPFYSRSVLKSHWLGEDLTCMHETLNVPRFSSTVVQMMLPWRMPRIT